MTKLSKIKRHSILFRRHYNGWKKDNGIFALGTEEQIFSFQGNQRTLMKIKAQVLGDLQDEL